MKKILGIMAALALVTSANAAVRFYFTSSADAAGLVDTTNVFNDTDGSQTDGTSYLLNDDLPGVGVPEINPTLGEYLYLWVEFEAEPNGRKIQGINLVANDAAFQGLETEADRGIYLGDDQAGDSGSKLRWETSSKTTDLMTLAGITTPGIKNSTATNNSLFLYNGIKNGRHYALLGAIKPDAPSNGNRYEIRIGLGKNGVSYSGQAAPNVKTGGDEEEWSGAVRTEPEYLWGEAADAVIVPEPASMLLLALAGLALRRR